MKYLVKTALVVLPFTLSGCLAPEGDPNQRAKNGAVIGGMIGGLLGSSNGNTRGVIAGVAVGAAAGALIGHELDKQEAELRDSLASRGIGIENTGSELIVTLPEDITFDTGSAAISPSLQADLEVLAESLGRYPDTTVDIIGHTDNIGEAEFNQRLSAERADSVYLLFASEGVAEARMRAFGRGESEPIASNLSDEGRAQNRRVEIIIRPIG